MGAFFEIVALIAGVLWVLSFLLPVLAFRFVQLPSQRVVRSINAEWVNEASRPQLMKVASELEALGFRLVDVLLAQDPERPGSSTPPSPTVTFTVLLAGPDPTIVGCVYAVCAARDASPGFLFTELYSELEDGTQLTTKNSTVTQAHLMLGPVQTWVVPEVQSCRVLLALHRLRLETFQTPRRALRLDDPIAFSETSWNDELRVKQQAGLMMPAAGGFVAHSWKGALWMALSHRWPFTAISERRRRADVGPLLERALKSA